MELKPGYKQTEIGILPLEWEAVPTGDLFTFKNGLNKAKQFFGHGTPIVNYMDVFGHSSLRIRKIKGRVDVNSKELSAYNVRRGDVFFTRTSETVDEIGTASVMLDNPEKTVFSGFVLRARPANRTLDDTFKAFCFAPSYFRQQITARASYTTRALTNGRSLSAALLARPPIAEQRAIATALSDVDALLEGLGRLIVKKRNLKQAAMQQLLTGKTRLPGFEWEWEAGYLGDVVICLEAGVSVNSVDDGLGGNSGRILKTSAVANGSFNQAESKAIAGFDKHRAKTMPLKNTLLISRMNTPDLVGEVGYVDDDYPELFLPDRLWMARFRSEFSGSVRWLSFLLSTRKYKLMIRAAATGTSGSMKNISKESLLSLPINFPNPKEQIAIATILSDMDAEIEALQQRRLKTRDIKQAMMQELLTGKTRLI